MGAIVLAILAVVVVVSLVGIGAWVVVKTPDSADLEARKVRFAAATFTGLLSLIVFASLLYIAYPAGAGKEVFVAIVPAVTPIAGAIIGYLFGTKNSEPRQPQVDQPPAA
jgi:cytochrome bd-type quinol oxidase subunit 2